MKAHTRQAGAERHDHDRRRHNVYVVELDKRVLAHRKFSAANPHYDPGKACLYVGMTGLEPDERFANHKKGHKANAFVRDYGLWLRRRLYQRLNPLTYDEACETEVELAEYLRKKGHAVWQN